MNRGIIQRTNN